MERENLVIKIILDKDRKTIYWVDISGCVHYMFDESREEHERYQNMTVAQFIEDYVKYYESVEETTVDDCNFASECPHANQCYHNFDIHNQDCKNGIEFIEIRDRLQKGNI